jgi:hypothetical protein
VREGALARLRPVLMTAVVESTPDPAAEAKPEAREATETALSGSASHS